MVPICSAPRYNSGWNARCARAKETRCALGPCAAHRTPPGAEPPSGQSRAATLFARASGLVARGQASGSRRIPPPRRCAGRRTVRSANSATAAQTLARWPSRIAVAKRLESAGRGQSPSAARRDVAAGGTPAAPVSKRRTAHWDKARSTARTPHGWPFSLTQNWGLRASWLLRF